MFHKHFANTDNLRTLVENKIIMSTMISEKARFDARLPKEQIIVSERDSQIFFDATTNPQKPSETLKDALKDYNTFIANSK